MQAPVRAVLWRVPSELGGDGRLSTRLGDVNDSIQPGLIDNPGTDESEEKDFPVPAPLESHGPARVISMCNQKGVVFMFL